MAEAGDQASNADNDSQNGNASGEDDGVMKQLQHEEEELAKRVEAEVSEELSLHMAKLELELKLAFDERMSAIQQQCSTQAAQVIDTRQTDILRTNKVLRDVSRALGTNWRPVFEMLMSSFPADVTSAELAKIEAERPILQAYKSLMTWKDACGAEFNVRQLVDVLRLNGKDDLAAMSLQILDSNEKDSLITFSGFGKPGGLATSSTAGPAVSRATASSTSRTCVTGGAGDASSTTASNLSPDEAVDDRHLLQLAKRLGADWEPVARKLPVANDEIGEILASEGHTYQGAFKMLWAWRDSTSDPKRALDGLISTLGELGRQDAAEVLLR